MSVIAANPSLLTTTTLARPTPVAPTSRVCAHCGLPVPPGLVRTDDVEQFCCHGCETAFSVIHSCGLDAYYSLVAQASDRAAPARSTRLTYAEFDDPTFRSLYCRPLPGDLLRTDLLLEGVHCAACLWLVERLPSVVPGVLESRLDMSRSAVSITFDPAQMPLSRIARALDTLGYPAHPARSPAARESRRLEDRRMLVRIAVAGACAGNIMLLFFALYAGMFEGMERGYEQLFRWVSMALNTICLAWPGSVFGRRAVAALRTRTFNLDVPIALGLYLGGAWGIWKTIAGTFAPAAAGASDIYFDSISALIFFLLVGRFVQQRQLRSAADALEMLFSITPRIARRADANDVVTEVPTEALIVGDIVEVRAGDSAPADGVVCAADPAGARVDLSFLTGESRPIAIRTGERIAAGAVNLSTTLRLRVEATGESTRVGRLMRLVEDASRRRAAIVRLADRWGLWLLWTLLTLAAATLAIWWHAGAAIAIDHAAALLIATCPCGLGLATPMAMTVAIGRAAKRGILVMGGDALQSLASPGRNGTIVLDKTGTITHGQLSLVHWYGDDVLRPLIASLETHCSHPAARALANAAPACPDDASNVIQHHGAGVQGLVRGHQLLAGTRTLLTSHSVRIGAAFDQVANEAIADGLSPVFIACDCVCAAVAALGDPVRPEARDAIRSIRARGWKVEILSGDHPGVVATVAREVGVDPADCRAGATPEQKLARIRQLAADRSVVMVGDGVNDAAALAAATVGIAVRGGAEPSMSAADVTLAREGLKPLVEAIDGARHTMRTIHWTIAASLGYNAVAASLSMAGLISPLLAAFIMPASSFTVVAFCLRSRAFLAGRSTSS